MGKITRQEIYEKAKVGIIAGAIGGILILVPFTEIGITLRVGPWAFYTMIGLAVGLHGIQAAFFGVVAHMLTAITIGAVFCTCSILHPILRLTKLWKGMLGGAVTGLEVYAIFFMPITLFIVIPAFGLASGGAQNSMVTPDERALIAVMQDHLQDIMWGALVLHVIFGFIIGIYSSMYWIEKPEIQKSL